MKFPKLFLIAFIFFSACTDKKQNSCDLKNPDWQQIDNNTSISFCKPGDKDLQQGDSITITYIGVLNKENELEKSSADIFRLNYNDSSFGSFIFPVNNADKPIQQVIKKMKKNSVAFVRIIPPTTPDPERYIRLYFAPHTRDTVIRSWMKRIQHEPYNDSMNYISSDAAIREFENNNDNDSTWKKMLKNNPLP